MTKSELLTKLSGLKTELKEQFGIEKIALFGSYARDEAKEDSDIDIVILKMKEKNFSKRVQAKEFLEKKLHKKIDIGYFESMKTFIKNRIKKDFIYV